MIQQNGIKLEEYLKIWETTKIEKNLSLFDSAMFELQDYFGYSKDETFFRLRNSEEMYCTPFVKHRF
jgi:hypothetical protein